MNTDDFFKNFEKKIKKKCHSKLNLKLIRLDGWGRPIFYPGFIKGVKIVEPEKKDINLNF